MVNTKFSFRLPCINRIPGVSGGRSGGAVRIQLHQQVELGGSGRGPLAPIALIDRLRRRLPTRRWHEVRCCLRKRGHRRGRPTVRGQVEQVRNLEIGKQSQS